MTLHVSLTITQGGILIPFGFVGFFGGVGWVFFFGLRSILPHVLPSFGLGLFRAIFILKTHPRNRIGRTDRNLGGKKIILRMKMVSAK